MVFAAYLAIVKTTAGVIVSDIRYNHTPIADALAVEQLRFAAMRMGTPGRIFTLDSHTIREVQWNPWRLLTRMGAHREWATRNPWTVKSEPHALWTPEDLLVRSTGRIRIEIGEGSRAKTFDVKSENPRRPVDLVVGPGRVLRYMWMEYDDGTFLVFGTYTVDGREYGFADRRRNGSSVDFGPAGFLSPKKSKVRDPFAHGDHYGKWEAPLLIPKPLPEKFVVQITGFAGQSVDRP